VIFGIEVKLEKIFGGLENVCSFVKSNPKGMGATGVSFGFYYGSVNLYGELIERISLY